MAINNKKLQSVKQQCCSYLFVEIDCSTLCSSFSCRVSVCVLMCPGYEFDRVSTCVAEDKPSNLCLSQSEKYNAVTHSLNGCAKTQSTLSIMEINSCHCNLRK